MICFRRTGRRLFVGGFVGCPNCLRHAATITTLLLLAALLMLKKMRLHLLHAQLSFTLFHSSTVHFFCSKNRTDELFNIFQQFFEGFG